MLKTIGRAAGGLAAGAAGTVAMGGMSFLIRRLVEPTSPISKTHYESVVEWATGALASINGSTEPQTDETEAVLPEFVIDDATRIRAGELTHLGFGALWGMVFALARQNREIRPLANGATTGIVLWLAAFEGYMPALGITRSLREMSTYERARTFICHLTYGITTFTFLRVYAKSGGSK